MDNVVIKALFVGCESFAPAATLVEPLDARPGDGGVELSWTVSSAADVRSLNVYRSYSEDGAYLRINHDPIPVSVSGRYHYLDAGVSGTVYYRLAAVLAGGEEADMGSTRVVLGGAQPTRSFAFAIAGANPFQGGTALSYTLPARSPVRIEVFSVAGQKMRTLVDRVDEAGTHTVPFELAGGSVRTLSPGMYLVSITAGKDRRTLRVVGLE